MDKNKLVGVLENILFTAGDSVAVSDIAQALGCGEAELSAVLEEEIRVRESAHGLMIRRLGDRVQLATRPAYAPLLQSLFGVKNEEELTQAMMETLSIIAYRQPVTRAEIEEVRGVNTSYTLNALLEKRLIAEAGRKEALGRPILYVTSEGFLRHFGLSSVDELPQEKLA